MKLKPRQRTLKLGRYPYTYARVSVMRSKLLKKQDYDKMLKMGPYELVKFLSDYDYRREINTLSVQLKGLSLIEQALSKNLARTLNKMKNISQTNLRLFMEHYLLRYDVENIKIILRAKYTKVYDDEAFLGQLLVPVGYLTEDDCKALMKQPSIDELLKNLKIFSFAAFARAYEKYRSSNTIVDIENRLDQLYYNRMLAFADTLPKGKSDMLWKFFVEEITISNIITLLRFVKNGMDAATTRQHLFFFKDMPKNKTVRGLMDSKSLTDLLERLEKSEYRQVLREGIAHYKKTGSFIELETVLYQYLLKRTTALMRQHPLSVEVLVGFLFAKEIEVKNLSMIAKANQLGLGEDFVESRLIAL